MNKEKEPIELLTEAINEVSVAAEKLLNSGLNMDCIVTLLHRKCSTLNRSDIQMILESLPQLKEWYLDGE